VPVATPEAVRRRIDTAENLRSIVRTMKALASMSIRQYEEAVVSLAAYARTVEHAFRVLLRARPEMLQQPPAPPPRRVGAIVLGSDHGLCGAFNEQVAAFYREGRPGAGGPLLAVGRRVAGLLADGGTPPAEVLPCPASAARVAGLVGDLLERVAAWRAAGMADGVRLYFNAPRGAAGYRPLQEVLLPLDGDRLRALAAEPWRPRALPAFAGDWEALLSAVVQQHLFVTLYRALARSLASEHASRLTAMHAAERNIEERLFTLRGEFQRRRQEAVTTELLDIVSGFEALTPGPQV
jgi:F-type H+-transporting ATPase subunit gamma